MIDLIRELKARGDVAALNALIPYAAVVGFDCRLDEGQLVTVLGSRPSNMGNTMIRSVHGGVVGALLEHAAIMQLLWGIEELERLPKIVNLSIDYLRPCLCDIDTYARATIVKQGRRVANVRIVAWQDDPNRPVAAGHSHFIVG